MIAARAIRRQPVAWPIFALAAFWLAACATTKPSSPPPGEVVDLRGLASWYGDEFAGRPTANGEIFDPKQMTAAHRTFPFGTILDVTYLRTGRTARVRVNDRGPFVGNRIIDLSYAAASEIGMVDDGVGDVQIAVVTVGGGELEPPKPFNVTIPPASPEPASAVATAAPETPPPAATHRPVPSSPPPPEPVVLTEDLPKTSAPPAAPSPAASPQPNSSVAGADPHQPVAQPRSGWLVQLGAFSVEANANELKAAAERIGGPVAIQQAGGLFRVRAGPWATRSRAIEERERFEAAGYPAIVVYVE